MGFINALLQFLKKILLLLTTGVADITPIPLYVCGDTELVMCLALRGRDA